MIEIFKYFLLESLPKENKRSLLPYINRPINQEETSFDSVDQV